jgi:Microtubule-binding stalk of dynein motor
VIADIRKNYITDPKFTPEAAEKASKAAAGLCKWVYALETYDRVAKEVAPKKEALRVAEEQLEVLLYCYTAILLYYYAALLLYGKIYIACNTAKLP